nr:hypothetical protein [uncultured Campylobacter sp.]
MIEEIDGKKYRVAEQKWGSEKINVLEEIIEPKPAPAKPSSSTPTNTPTKIKPGIDYGRE